ncbi:MAG: hypothetical protein ACKV2U_30120, partial [Bryobacteraceae bacterium]
VHPGGPPLDPDSGGMIHLLLPRGINSSISGANARVGAPNEPLEDALLEALSCPFKELASHVASSILGAATMGAGACLTPLVREAFTVRRAGDMCDAVEYPLINASSSQCLADEIAGAGSLYSMSGLRTHRFVSRVWKPVDPQLGRSIINIHVAQSPAQLLDQIKQHGFTIYMNTPRADWLLDAYR